MTIDQAGSVVSIRSNIPEDGFTAASLGTERAGSGVVISDGGLVLTIGYLVVEAETIWLTAGDGRVVAGHALAYDQESGLGLVQALGRLDAPAAEFGRSARANVGDKAALVGGPGNRRVDTTIVSKQQFAGYWEYLVDEAIFTAPAHPSWGGAGLFGEDGKLLGIGSLMLQMSAGGETRDINMVVPIDLLPPILDELLAHGQTSKPPKPWLGVFAADSEQGVRVLNVDARGPASAAGLRRGDVISDVRDQEVDDLADFYRAVWGSGQAGTEIPIRILRDGREMWLRIKSSNRGLFLKRPQLQ